jgi:DNA-binding transcriptional ArsR family regulator
MSIFQPETETCSMMEGLDDRALERVAEYFRALSEPLRLKILNALREGERNVGELTELFGCSQANTSKHLSVLAKSGFVERAARATNVYYRIADPSTYQLCDLVCGQIGKRFAQQAELQAMFTSPRKGVRTSKSKSTQR